MMDGIDRMWGSPEALPTGAGARGLGPAGAARVWPHSASPIFAQQIMSKALAARQTGDITGEDFLEFLNLPGLDLLRPKARRIAEAQAEHQDKVMQVAKLKALKK